MPIVSKSDEAPKGGSAASVTPPLKDIEAQKKKARTYAKQQQIAERIAAASAELASGVSEAAAAVEELQKTAQQIAAGAEQASGASQELLSSFKHATELVKKQMHITETSRVKVENQAVVVKKAGSAIEALVRNVVVASEKQAESVKKMAELEKQAESIGQIVKTVAKIADQTNLLALNAAIEAARAGKHGKGFAVVADEVRALAETSEKSATQIQGFVSDIQKAVNNIAESINTSAKRIKDEADKGEAITKSFKEAETSLDKVSKMSQEIASAAVESDAAAREALKASESVAAAAEEQASSVEEITKTVGEQASAFQEIQQSSNSLVELSDELRGSSDVVKSAEEVASAAEELSSALQEINRSSQQIFIALEQISKGAQAQAGATEELSASITQIEKGSLLAQERGKLLVDITIDTQNLMNKSKEILDELVKGILTSLEDVKENLTKIKDLELLARKIDKVVDAISVVAIQTNMLAVSGAIEAARAGEFGKGFAVVAADIRNLAHDSASNSEQVKDMVKAIQDQINIVVRDLDELTISTLESAEKAKDVAEDVISIVKEMAEIKDGGDEILKGTEMVVTAIGQAKKAIEQIAAAAKEAEKAVEQAAAAAKQQSQGASELAAAIEEIASLADELQTMG